MVVNAEVQWQLTRAAERQAELNATAPLPAAGPSRSPTAVRGALRRARSAGPIPRVANLSPSRQVPSFASVVNDVLAARAAFQKPTPALAPKPPMDKSSALWLRGTAAIRIGRLRERLKKVELENRMLKARIDADQEAEKASVAASDAAKLAREALAKRSLERQKEREQAAARARARQEEEVAAAAEQPAAPSKKTEEMWTLETWLESMPLPQIVSRSLLKHLSPDGPPEPGLEQAFVDSLGSTSDLPTFLALLRDAMVMPIYEGTSQIQSLMAMKDTLVGIMKRPADFVKRLAQARLASLPNNEADARDLARLQLLSLKAQQHLVGRVAADKFKAVAQTPIQGWWEALTDGWDPKRDFARAMLHAERLAMLLADEAIAEILLDQANRFPERRELYQAFMERALPRARFLHDQITTTGDRLLRRLKAQEPAESP